MSSSKIRTAKCGKHHEVKKMSEDRVQRKTFEPKEELIRRN
jgi:hypothetical protein